MKRNIGITDRIIRFVIVDLLLGASYLGIEIPPVIGMIAFLISLSLIFTIVFGYSVIYHLLGVSTRQVESQTVETSSMKDKERPA
jgi:hypothetical protein